MKKLFLSLATALALLAPAAALACEKCEEASQASGADVSATQGTKFTIPVEGMSCGACANRLTNVLEQVEGVKAVEVSVKDKRAIVVLDEKNARPERVVEKINEVGFRAGDPVKGTPTARRASETRRR